MTKVEQNRRLRFEMLLKHCRDEHDNPLPEIIHSDYGVGVTFKDKNGIEYTTLPPRRYDKNKRILYFEITSWKGISVGAIHYYGKLYFSSPELSYIENGKEQVANIGGYFPCRPKQCDDGEIQIIRQLTQREIDEDEWGDRWRGHRAGDETTGFEDFDELKALGKKIFKARFTGDWKLEINDKS